MTSKPSPRAVLLCGKTEEIGVHVIAGLKPEFDVIQFIMSPESGAIQIPLILQNKTPPSDSKLGSHDYSTPPFAVILGAYYTDEMIDSLRKSCGQDVNKLHWLRPDTDKPAPPPGPAYGKAMVDRVKEKMWELDESGQKGGDVIWY